jgi:hypothetical protein
MNENYKQELSKLDRNALLNVAAVLEDFARLFFASTNNDKPFYFGAFDVNKYFLARNDLQASDEDYESRTVRKARLEALEYLTRHKLVKATSFNNTRTERHHTSGELYEGVVTASVTIKTAMFPTYYSAVVELCRPYLSATKTTPTLVTRSHQALPSYNVKTRQLKVRGKIIDIDPHSDQEALCRLLFPKGSPVKLPVQKGDLFDALDFSTFNMTAIAKRRANKKVYSAKDAINLKVLKAAGVSEFLIINKMLWFNTKYL